RRVAFSPDSRILATATTDGRVRLLEVATGKLLHLLGDDVGQNAVAFSPDGRLLAADHGTEVRLWEVATGKVARALGGQGSPVRALAFSADGRRLALGTSSEEDRRAAVELWDVADGKLLRTLADDAI